MTKEKQIEEMRKSYKQKEEMDAILCRIFGSPFAYKIQYSKYGGYEGYKEVYHKDVVNELYNAGYRKASDVAREIFEEIIPALEYTTFSSTLARNGTLDYFYSLKKKYTGGWKKRDCSNCKNRNEEGCSFGNMCITSNSPYATPSHWKAKEITEEGK